MFTFCEHYLKVFEYFSSLEETMEPRVLFPLTQHDFGFETRFPQTPQSQRENKWLPLGEKEASALGLGALLMNY